MVKNMLREFLIKYQLYPKKKKKRDFLCFHPYTKSGINFYSLVNLNDPGIMILAPTHASVKLHLQ